MPRRIGFVGTLGHGRPPNGQTRKAREVLDLLRRTGRSVGVADVSRPARVVRIVPMAWRGDTLVIVLNRKGLWIALALAGAMGVVRRRRRSVVVVPVVGGWLADQLARRRPLRWLARGVDDFLVESPRLVDDLRRLGLPASELANFRHLPIDRGRVRRRVAEPLRLCFAGRVRVDKGVVLAAELVTRLIEEGVPARLDVYGPVEEAEALDRALRRPHVAYRGGYETPDEAVELLSGYDLLVLPSSYPGECMPGVVVEAAFAALPAVVSDWKDLGTIVDDGVTGYVCPLDGFVAAAATRVRAGLAAGELPALSREVLEQARRRFTEEAAREVLLGRLGELEAGRTAAGRG
jgi:glycosyltransferase involved in cell wall biosynthesis